MQKYDLIIIGGGPAGFPVAAKVSKKLKTLLVEKYKYGGVCLHSGCMPSKTYLHAAHVLNKANTSKNHGITGNINFDFSQLKKHKDRIINRLERGIKQSAEKYNFETVFGEAKALDQNTIEVNGEKYSFDKLVIATGSTPKQIPKFKKLNLPTTDTFFQIEKQPQSLLIIGGGVIGVEFAEMLSNFGTEVYLVEAEKRLLPQEEPEVSEFARKKLARQKVKSFLGNPIESIEKDSNYKIKIADKTIETEEILLAIGREPFFWGKDVLDYKITKNKYFLTSKPNIYAVGDITDQWKLAHEATYQAGAAAAHILGNKFDYNPDLVPRIIYTHPECASIGSTTDNKITVPLNEIGHAHTQDENEGFVSLYIEGDYLKGALIVSPEASSLITLFTLAIKEKINVKSLKQIVFAHPTYSELLKKVINKI